MDLTLLSQLKEQRLNTQKQQSEAQTLYEEAVNKLNEVRKIQNVVENDKTQITIDRIETDMKLEIIKSQTNQIERTKQANQAILDKIEKERITNEGILRITQDLNIANSNEARRLEQEKQNDLARKSDMQAMQLKMGIDSQDLQRREKMVQEKQLSFDAITAEMEYREAMVKEREKKCTTKEFILKKAE